MFGLVNCNASIFSSQTTDPTLFLVRTLVKNWLWPIITFFGVTGNILAIIVLTKRRMIMSSTNNYLVALAFVDIVYLILTLILNTSQHPCFASTTLPNILLAICRPIVDFSSNTSVWITVTFTVERWVAITYPLKSRTWCTVHRARKIIISVMCAALICTSPSAFEMKLVRVIQIKNSTNSNEKPIYTSYIRAEHTALAHNLLYHQIYFNFVTFAIIWIPLLLLVIFNAILILYVHRSKQNEPRISDGVKLRRHNNRGNQGEQRKTTIMLIAVVIVFTVCQIPQAISLTVQSFFPILSQTSKVLIYNNFANCLVAINASMNFLLYCCFSERFRSTFGSSFAFINKYYAHIIGFNWKMSTNNNNNNNKQQQDSLSLDNMSLNIPYNQSTYSLYGTNLNTRISNMSNDLSQKYLKQTLSNTSQRQQSWLNILERFRPNDDNNNNKFQLKQTLVGQTSETSPSSPTTSVIKSPSLFLHQSHLSNNSICRSWIEETIVPIHSSIVSFSPEENKSNSMCLLNRSTNERLKKTSSVGSSNVNKTLTTLHSSYYSQRSLDNNKNKEPIWIKRRLSNRTIEQLFDRRKSFLLKEILDVTV